MTLDFETDQFLTLLTDALRAGPGSPPWHEALSWLKQQGMEDADEYTMLLNARQHLESGKSYRQIIAGPEFTKKVMAAIEEEAAGKAAGGIPTPTIIAIGAALVGLIIVILIGYLLWASGRSQTATLVDLENQTFTHDLLSASFGGGVPAGWNQIGSLKLSFGRDMHPAERGSGELHGGGLVSAAGLPANEALAMEVTLHPPAPNDAVIAQVFVTDQPDFDKDRASSPHELVWSLQPVQVKNVAALRPEVVLPDGTFASRGDDLTAVGDTMTIRVAIDGDFVLVDMDGKRLYAGPHDLAPGKARYFGVRFVRTGSWLKTVPAVEALRIIK